MEKRKIPYKGRIESGNYKLERNGNGSCLLPLNGFDLFNRICHITIPKEKISAPVP